MAEDSILSKTLLYAPLRLREEGIERISELKDTQKSYKMPSSRAIAIGITNCPEAVGEGGGRGGGSECLKLYIQGRVERREREGERARAHQTSSASDCRSF